jgi:hypothetical protein
MAKDGKRSAAWIAKEVPRPEVEGMLQIGHSPEVSLVTPVFQVRRGIAALPFCARSGCGRP